MKKILLFFLFCLVSPAIAADNAVIVTPGTGVTMRSIDVGTGVQSMGNSLVNSSGTNIIGAGTTVPISGSLTNISGTISLPTGAATAANQATEISSLATIAMNTGAAIPAGSAVIGYVGGDGTAGTASTHVVSIQGIASMTKLLVTPDSVALPANQSVNLAQVAGATTPVGSGVQATALRTTLATDSPGIITLGGATPANSVPVVSAGFTYSHIATATTTTAKSGAGVLHTICVNTLGTVASTITVDDATSATTPTIAIINSLALLGCQTYDVAFSTGLTLVTTGTVAPDVTVSWR